MPSDGDWFSFWSTSDFGLGRKIEDCSFWDGGTLPLLKFSAASVFLGIPNVDFDWLTGTSLWLVGFGWFEDVWFGIVLGWFDWLSLFFGISNNLLFSGFDGFCNFWFSRFVENSRNFFAVKSLVFTEFFEISSPIVLEIDFDIFEISAWLGIWSWICFPATLNFWVTWLPISRIFGSSATFFVTFLAISPTFDILLNKSFFILKYHKHSFKFF